MRIAALLFCFFAFLTACGDSEPAAPAGPRFLNSPPEVWAGAITDKDMRKQQAELNRLALGRPDAVPVIIALLAWDDPKVVSGAYLALEANLGKVEKAGGDTAPWIPAFEAAADCADEGIVRDAKAVLARIRE